MDHIFIFTFLSSHSGLEMASVSSSLQFHFVVPAAEVDDAEAAAAVAVDTETVVVAVAVSVNEYVAAETFVQLRLFALTGCWNIIAGLIHTTHSSSLKHHLEQLVQSTPSDAGFPP